MKIVNLTQHAATAEQLDEGVFEPSNKSELQALLTFDSIPSQGDLAKRALAIANIATQSGADAAMIGGAPYLMRHLEVALEQRGIGRLYAFAIRESVEEIQVDGSVRKTNVFRHAGFVGANQ